MIDNLEHGWIVNDNESEPQVAFRCECCGEPIYYGDDYYDFDGNKWCAECVQDCKREA